jgi:hypothetical protein
MKKYINAPQMAQYMRLPVKSFRRLLKGDYKNMPATSEVLKGRTVKRFNTDDVMAWILETFDENKQNFNWRKRDILGRFL